MNAQAPGRRTIVVSWVSNLVFALGSIPALIGTSSGEGISAGVCLVLFGVSLVVWVWAFAIAVTRSSQGDDIAVGSLFLIEGAVDRSARRSLYGSFALSLVITAIGAGSNPFAVLVPMLSLGFVGFWGARHACFPMRQDVTPSARPLRPDRSTRQGGAMERRADGRTRQ
ncbi:MAG: hypothetical protein JJE46_12120 [Acidimicrobiia bacterium]|nr:hypothetical protein [Acidimicrobiia bacterium]